MSNSTVYGKLLRQLGRRKSFRHISSDHSSHLFEFVQEMEITLAILKPHVLKNTVAFRRITDLIKENFTILHSKEVHITKQLSEQFYAEHHGKFFYNRLTTFMGSGPSYALILESPDSIKKWRQLMGPTKVYKAIYAEPDCLRALYGLSDTRNACHGSDSVESARKEISILFPELQTSIRRAGVEK